MHSTVNSSNGGVKVNDTSDMLNEGRKYLDDYGTYTGDGYMAPKHLYAEVGKPIPPLGPIPSQYSIPSHQYGSPPNPSTNFYEDVRNSANPDQQLRPVEEVYEQPSVTVATSNADTASNESCYKVPPSVSLAASEYDVPRRIINNS